MQKERGSSGLGKGQVGKKVLLLLLAAPPIILGMLKLILHLNSVYRLGFLDYIVSLGLIAGGLFVFSRPRSMVALFASSILFSFELYKAAIDYRDHFDVFIAIVAMIYLTIPVLSYVKSKSTS